MSQATLEFDAVQKIDTGIPLTIYNPLESLFSEHAYKKAGLERMAEFVAQTDGLVRYFVDGNCSRESRFSVSGLFGLTGAIASLDAEFWSRVMSLTDVLECMPAAKRNEWSKMIGENAAPPFERESVLSTIQTQLLNRERYFAEKVDGVFRNLSGQHVTNSPGAFGVRMIMDYLLDSYGYLNSQRVEFIHDLRNVITKLEGRGELRSRGTYQDLDSILREQAYGQWFDFDGGSFRVKIFKKGTVHLEVHPDISWKLNQALATLYPMAIPPEFRRKPAKPPKDHILRHDMLPLKVVYALSQVLECSRFSKCGYRLPDGLSAEVKAQAEGVMAMLGGVKNRYGDWDFDYAPVCVLHEISRTGCVPEQKSHQFYPTPEVLGMEAADLLGFDDEDDYLEPEAGTGNLAAFLPKDRTTCVEISSLHCAVLKAKGFNTVQADFLSWNPGKKFRKILMNPPFSDGRALDHLKHAASMLADDGRLVAILPGSLVRKHLVDGWNHEWSNLREGGFADTKVNIAILVLTK